MALRLLFAACMISLSLGGADRASAQSGPVVVELFTSQGCSSCPPADAYLGRIADRDDLIPLSLHVDYWDYLGWRDVFGQPAHTARQRSYAGYLGERMVYTPQIVVQGREGMVGSHVAKVEAAITRAKAEPPGAQVDLALDGSTLVIDIASEVSADARCAVHLVWYSRAEKIEIRAGENRGRSLVYSNVVKGWSDLGAWSGGSKRLTAPAPTMADGVAVIVQDVRRGVIVGAARLELN